MMEVYLVSVVVTFVLMLIGSWFDTKPFHLTVADVGLSALFCLVPVVNVIVAAFICWYAVSQNSQYVILGGKE